MKQFARLPLAILVALSLLLTACTSLSSNGPTPEEVTIGFLTAMRAADWQRVAQHGDAKIARLMNEMEEDETGLPTAIMAQMTFEVGETRKVGSRVEVDAVVSLPDVEEILLEVMGEIFRSSMVDVFTGKEKDEAETEAEMIALFHEMLLDPDAPIVTSDVTVGLVRKGGSWKVTSLEGLRLGSVGTFD